VIGGNHSACAKMDMAKANPHYASYRRVLAWIFIGLSVSNARQLAWIHNIDNELRSFMTMIQKVNYIHMHFLENGEKASQDLKKECAMEEQFKD
jgi:hypothetical protein